MRALIIVSAGRRLPEQLRQLEASDQYPRTLLLEDTLNADKLDERYLERAPALRRAVYRALPVALAQAIEAYCVRRNYDVVISWSERISLLFATLLKVTRSATPHIALMYWLSPPKKAIWLRRVCSHMDRIVTWSQAQRDFAIHRLGIPARQALYIPYQVDERFWRPMQARTDTICAVGNEMRDYATLVEAMRGLNIGCQIVASAQGRRSLTAAPLPENVTLSVMSYPDLRALYARSRFVVVPLQPSDTNHGLTVILEAMAMGKAVICSQVRGHVDVIQGGATGLFVPQGDQRALRETIVYLWRHPEIADAMGRRARAYIERRHRFDQFVANIKRVTEEALAERQASTRAQPRARRHAMA